MVAECLYACLCPLSFSTEPVVEGFSADGVIFWLSARKSWDQHDIARKVITRPCIAKFNLETGNDGPRLVDSVEESVTAKRIQMRKGVTKMSSPLRSASVGFIPRDRKVMRAMLRQSVEE